MTKIVKGDLTDALEVFMAVSAIRRKNKQKNTNKKQSKSSVIVIISYSIFIIVASMVLAIFISFWMVERTALDAEAINTSGSIRMQTYLIAFELINQDAQGLKAAIDNLDKTWDHHSLRSFLSNTAIQNQFELAKANWDDTLKPRILSQHSEISLSKLQQQLDIQVQFTDDLVVLIQKNSEQKTNRLRLVLVSSMFISILIAFIVFQLLRVRLKIPLTLLTETARAIGEGNYKKTLSFHNNDELALLANTLNQSSQSIEEMQLNLEDKINQKTKSLQRSNVTLNYLFKIASQINNHQIKELNFNQIIDELSSITELNNIELCLMTPEGKKPYQQITPKNLHHCIKTDCTNCKLTHKKLTTHDGENTLRYPILFNGHPQGVLAVRCQNTVDEWKDQLIQSVADQITIALSIKEQSNTSRRLALSKERSVIARELHDSLAQALSYLQIQVSRLQKNQDKQTFEKQQAIINELREGISSAYQSLRDLLTTFRLTLSGDGLYTTLLSSIEQMQERTDISIALDYDIHNIPMSPAEEIHIVQIIREATQNAIKHSQGSQIIIRLYQDTDMNISISINDDGVGLPEKPEKLNHYGLAIMRERTKGLNGELTIETIDTGGTSIKLIFEPKIIAKN